MITKTIIHSESHHAGKLHLEYGPDYPDVVYLHTSAGGFSFCTSLRGLDCRQMAEALMKAAFAIEAQQPQASATGDQA